MQQFRKLIESIEFIIKLQITIVINLISIVIQQYFPLRNKHLIQR